MASPYDLPVSISPDMAALVREAVELGEHPMPEAVVEEALRLWSENRDDPVIEPLGGSEVVRALVEEGRRSGIAKPYDIEDLIAEENAALLRARTVRR